MTVPYSQFYHVHSDTPPSCLSTDPPCLLSLSTKCSLADLWTLAEQSTYLLSQPHLASGACASMQALSQQPQTHPLI